MSCGEWQGEVGWCKVTGVKNVLSFSRNLADPPPLSFSPSPYPSLSLFPHFYCRSIPLFFHSSASIFLSSVASFLLLHRTISFKCLGFASSDGGSCFFA